MSIGLPENAEDHATTLANERASILVVDEDPAFQLGLKTFLREYVGFAQVFTAESGTTAIERILADDSIDVISLDYQMPEMNGLEVLGELRGKLDRPLSVLMITGYPSDDLESRFRAFDSDKLLARHFLTKPIEFERLEPVILQAHAEVRAAKEIGLAIPDTGTGTPSAPAFGGNFASIRKRLDRQQLKLEEIEEQVRGMRSCWRADFWKVFFVFALIGAALYFDWFDKARPFGEKVVEDARAVFSPAETESDAAPPEAETEAAAPPETAPELSDDPESAGPVNEGRPL